jgi:hypothetical protein
MMLPKSNFREMSLQELGRYVLVHRDDEQAWEEFTSRERPNAIYFETNMPLSEQEAMLL